MIHDTVYLYRTLFHKPSNSPTTFVGGSPLSNLGSDRIFNLGGTQSWWGIRDYHYSGVGRKSFSIPVGQYYTGKNMELVLVSDNDWGSGNDITSSNVRVCANQCEVFDFEDPYKDRLLDLSSTQAFPNQDTDTGDIEVNFSGAMLSMTGNRWRKSAQTFKVTKDTLLEFIFYGYDFSEIHAIGFSDGESIDPSNVFQLAGHQHYGHQDYRYGGGEQSFSIPVGEFLSGSDMHLVFINDDDSNWNATTSFSMVKVCEVSCSETADDNIGNYLTLDTFDSFSDQDLHANLGLFEVKNNAKALTFSGNRWIASYDTYQISKNTVLHFDFSSNGLAEVQAIGFDWFGETHEQQFFNLSGSQDYWGIKDYRYTQNGSTQSFSIPIGDYFEGQNLRLVLVNDDDASGDPRSAIATFANIRLCDGSCP